MKRSTAHLIIQRVVALLAFIVFVGALKVWSIPLVSEWPDWVGLLGFVVLAVAILSSLGFGPWGRAVKRLLAEEHEVHQASSQP